MNTQLLLCLFTSLVAPPVAPEKAPVVAARPADSVVKVTASVRFPNPTQPWRNSKKVEVSGSGVVIAGNKILTNAHVLEYATEVYVQTGPGADKFEAKVESIGPDVDLAVLTVSDKKFFDKRRPLARSKAVPNPRDGVEVYGFSVGGSEMSVTKGVVSRVGYGFIQVSAAINQGNSGGPAVVDGKMVGVVFSRLMDAENVGYVIPNEEIDQFLDNAKGGGYTGKFADATLTQYQRLDNEGLRAYLKLDKKTQGVVASPMRGAEAGNPYQEFDVLTNIGEHKIDNEGMVRFASGLRVPFHGLIPRLARNGGVPISVMRKGKLLSLSLPVTKRDNRLIREFQGEQPSWFIHGPLAFSPVKEDAISAYLKMNPSLEVTRSPMLRRRHERVRFPGEELVVVTHQMFDHKIAKGYDDPVGQVLEEVNGQKVKNLRHLVEILRDSTDEFLKFRFADEGTEVLVFRRKELSKATEEVLEDAGIDPARRGSKDMLRVWNKGVRPAKDE